MAILRVRLSLNGDDGRLMTEARNTLESGGLIKRPGNTATYEGVGLDKQNVAAIKSLLDSLVANTGASVRLDHIWIYVEG